MSMSEDSVQVGRGAVGVGLVRTGRDLGVRLEIRYLVTVLSADDARELGQVLTGLAHVVESDYPGDVVAGGGSE